MSRRTVIKTLPAVLPVPVFSSVHALATAGDGMPAAPIGYRSTSVNVGGQTVPVAQWYPLSREEVAQAEPAQGKDKPYRYRIGIANLFKAFLGVKLPIPSPEVRSGDVVTVREDGTPMPGCKNGIIFCHGMLGSRFDMADLCSALARKGFVVSAADFAECISASFTPNEATSRDAIIKAEMERLSSDFGATEFGMHLLCHAPSSKVPATRVRCWTHQPS
jgi:hypothetical protein